MENIPHIIITSAPRSGSTSLTKLLGQQKDLFITNELGTYDDWDNKNKWANYINSKHWMNFVANESIFESHGLDLYSFRETVIKNKLSAQDIFRWLTTHVDVKLFGDKCPITYLRNMQRLLKKFPNSKFIIVVRDGRDVIASQIRGFHKWPPGNPNHAAHWMKATVQEAVPLWRDMALLTKQAVEFVPKDRLFVFRYEDAVMDSSSFCEKISYFLGVDIEDKNAYFKPVNLNMWKETHSNMESILDDDFKAMLSYFNY